MIDQKPGAFTREEKRLLKVLANKVMQQLELRKDNLQHKKKIRRTNQELKTTLSRLLEAQHTARIGSWDWDVNTGEFYWSPEMYRIFGLEAKSPKSVTFEDWQSMIHPDDLPAVREAITEGLKNHKPGNVEYRLKKSGNKEVWIQGKGSVTTNKKGKVVRISGTAQDITDKKRAEAERKHYIDTLEEMLFSISHKLRKPVTTILGLIDALQSDPLTEEQMKKYTSYFKSSADKMDGYTRQMTEFIQKNKFKITGRKDQKSDK